MKKNFWKKILTVSLLSTALLAGCSSGSSNASSDKSSAKGEITDKKVTIKFSWWGADNRHEAMKNVAKLYEKKHKNVTVKVEYGAWDGWQSKVLTQLSGKTEADVMQVNYNWLYSFGKGKNIFYDINKVSDYLKLDNWDKTYLKAMQVDGQQSAVPYGMTARVNLMNQALYKENGIEIPKTYSDLLKAGKVIGKNNTSTGKDNKYALINVGDMALDLFLGQMLYDNTGKVMQTDGKVNYTSAQVEKVLKQYKALEDAGAMPTYAQDSTIDTNSNPQWVEGRTGGVYEWANSLAQWTGTYKGGKATDDLKVSPYLQVSESKKPSVYVKPNFGYAISRNSKNPEVAADFINFIFTDKEAIKAAGDALGVSSNKVTYKTQLKENLVEGAVKDAYDMFGGYKQTVMDPYYEDENVRGQRYDVIEGFRTGKYTAAQAAKEFISKQQEALDKYYR
ncbi:ABC transporter substrate-binding protein [Lapidilactobacillus bayanensis]|uniref:ABC transporter substrate-binding protein n=1 Tax=Lapidilactobacillus bayanensis TaxID=2485998 RepID=UPI000F76ECF0|nr:extracellular solute-binding protein [Lapidilactobacillus bayanensis]